MRNEELWLEIQDLPPFSRPPGVSQETYDKAWHWLEKLQNEGKLRQIDLFKLLPLLAAVYQAGLEAGQYDVETQMAESPGAF